MPGRTVLLDHDGPVAWIRLNRPDQMNAISPDLIEDLASALDAVESEGVVRVVVLTGTGRAFCAGGDLKSFRERVQADEQSVLVASLRRMMEVFRRIETFPCPVIAAVNGVAVAGGLELILCCDIVLAAESARIGDGHLTYGVVPGAGSSVRLPRRLARNVAHHLLLTGDLVPARRWLDWGLVNEVVPDAELVRTASELAARIASRSPVGLRRVKSMVADGLDQPVEVALRNELASFEAYSHSEDFLEGLTAFAEKRAPSFRGR